MTPADVDICRAQHWGSRTREKGRGGDHLPGTTVGDSVEPKQQVVIVEAMKMENPVPARARGTVKAVNFKVGDQVDTTKPIIELELTEE